SGYLDTVGSISKKETAKKRHNTGRPEATDDGDKLRNCSIEEKGYELIRKDSCVASSKGMFMQGGRGGHLFTLVISYASDDFLDYGKTL
ncbi:hypothetical protein L9F63_027858, partial [Diploptera punctata]